MEETPMEMTTQVQETGDDLDIYEGMTVEALTLGNQLTFVGKVARFSNGTVTIRESAGQELPPVLYNKEIKLRFFQGEQTQVLHGKICGSTQLIWKLDRLERKFAAEMRAFFRQHVTAQAEALCTQEAGENRAPAPCKIVDISAGGLLMKCRELYQVGDVLEITEARIVEEIEPFDFRCTIRRIGEQEGREYPYGCQFECLSPKEEDRLLRAIFIAQRKEIQTQKERGAP